MHARRLVSKVSAWLCGIAGVALLLSAPALGAPSAPSIEGESLVKVTATSATLQAEIDAQGASTEYHFEYGRCASAATCSSSGYEKAIPVPDAVLGAESAVEDVSVHPQDLLAGSAYHMRVIAHNAFGTTEGQETGFATQSAAVLALPDDRAWEMVSPPQKEGAKLGVIAEGILQASADGDAFVDKAASPTEATPAGSDNAVDIFFGRGPNGWLSQTIAPAHDAATGPSVGKGQEYRFFSEDLSLAVVQPFGSFTPLSPEATESTSYLHTDYVNGDPGQLCTASCFTPLVSAANVPAGTIFGEEPNGTCEHFECGPYSVGATPDLSHVLLRSPVALTSTSTEDNEGFYEWSAGRLELLNLFPPGEANEQGGPVAILESLSTAGGLNQIWRHAVSNDGSRVIWAGRGSQFSANHLYVRDTASQESTRIDLPNADAVPGEGAGEALYMTSTGDASRIFFLDSERLTGSSTANRGGAGEPDLYEYNFSASPGSRLTDLTVDDNAGESAGVQQVIGASEDGSYVYFAASGVLAQGAQPGRCGFEESGETPLCNLYVRHGGTTTFIAGLSPQDYSDWETLYNMPARVSPNGRWLAFVSNRDLTGYDTKDARSGQPDEEVYLYDAAASKLICASCNPTGARPVGLEYGKENFQSIFTANTWVAAEVPPWTRFDLTEVHYQSRYLSDTGRLLFNSHDGLAPQDVNGVQDVYEWEPAGVGDCSASQATFSEKSGGCVAPISSGTSNEESTFLDASEGGGNVFFLTAAKLLSQDFDNAADIYDARECAGASTCFAPAPAEPPPCNTGDSCKAAPSPQPELFGSPASATFAGVGNVTVPVSKATLQPKSLTRAQRLSRALKACRRERGARRRVCERKARSRYRVKKSVKVKTTKRGRG
jgi:hypothetical protein